MFTGLFDLIEYQDEARRTNSPKELFRIWDEVCRYYDRGYIGKYELDEMKESIMPALHELSSLQARINEPLKLAGSN